MKRWAVVTTVYSGALLTHVFAKRQKHAVNEVLSVRLIYVPGIKQSASGKDKFLPAAFFKLQYAASISALPQEGDMLVLEGTQFCLSNAFSPPRGSLSDASFKDFFLVCTHTS